MSSMLKQGPANQQTGFKQLKKNVLQICMTLFMHVATLDTTKRRTFLVTLSCPQNTHIVSDPESLLF